ncbi:unnamed protein product [Owenia fusiformis]|uniref:Rab3 GTPase-activating protein non-catalytic subunit n=1 Tax=Owenia fusiformis TaxID=6347 RepID=A0A8S4PHI5_OWEFU|nr:unnamed protein product [Owenia fusiformis]
MSCQLNVQTSFRDIEGVRKFLFLKSSFEEDDADWKNDDWEWKDDVTENDGNKENDVKGLGETWLQECVIALSPTNDVIAVAYEDRIVILEQKYDPSENSGELETKFNTVWQGSLAQENGEEITALACIPLASQKKSTQGGPDWTCLVAGFTSGYIRIYTENGTLLLSQLFHEEVVSQIKCRTYQLPHFPGLPEQPEDLSILYSKALVTIDGFSLYQSLRVCRNQVARATASGSDVIQPPPLAYKKWGLQGQEFIKDHISCGVVTPNPFDQMQTASMLGGYKAKVKATPPASNLYLTAGSGPYTGFYYAIEGSGQPILTDVALAVASKLKSALFNAASGWLGFGGSAKKAAEQKDKKPKIEPATALGIRFGIPDRRRIGESIVLSPTNTLAATTDSFGRVLLIDVAKGITVRMWKGYRDAQLGFVDVKEDGRGSKQSADRAALFLIIYAPRRGILEVWATQQGARVAAFNVHKGCQLVCLSHGMMGLNSGTAKSVKTPNLQCCLIEPDGNIRAIEIPFHLALSDKNSRRARDMHLLKTMKTHLKENHQQTDGLCADISSAMTDIKQAGVKQQAIERILSTRYLSAKYMQSVLNELIAQFEPQDPLSAPSAEGEETESLDIESRMLLQYCKLQEQLLQTYIAIDTLNTECASTPRPKVNEQIFSQDMCISESEVTYLIKKFDKYNIISDQPERKVQFSETTELSAADFLGCFSCQLHISAQEDITTARNVNLKKSLSEEKRLKLATFIFRSSIQGSAATELGVLLQFCEIPEDQLMDLVLELWLSEDAVDWTTLPNLYNLMHSITQLKDISDINVDHNKQSPWWQNVRDKCCASFNPSAALGAVITGRSVATSLQASQLLPENQNEEKQESSMDVLEADWESLTMDMTHWNILVKQLEDVLAISALLKLQPKGEPKTKGERISVSVNKLLEGGRGVMAEVVAKWIAQKGILPIMLCQKSHNASEEEMETDEHDEESEFLGKEGGINNIIHH